MRKAFGDFSIFQCSRQTGSQTPLWFNFLRCNDVLLFAAMYDVNFGRVDIT